MAPKTVMYALGGGSGHLARALAMSHRFDQPIVLHRAPFVPAHVPEGIRLLHIPDDLSVVSFRQTLGSLVQNAKHLVVDSFPAGVAQEIDDDLLAHVPRKTLIRRYVRPGTYPDYEAAAARYDDILVPYPAGQSEWETPTARDCAIGYAVRKLEMDHGERAPLVVIGPDEHLLPGLRAMLPQNTIFLRQQGIKTKSGMTVREKRRLFLTFIPNQKRYGTSLDEHSAERLRWALRHTVTARFHNPPESFHARVTPSQRDLEVRVTQEDAEILPAEVHALVGTVMYQLAQVQQPAA